MKEVRFFYNPDAKCGELPEEEASHAVRVLRLTEGDEIFIMDGKGTYYTAVIDEATKKHCRYHIAQCLKQSKQWNGWLHLAMAPTKNMDRTEWFAEKATEIGFDQLTFLDCQFSERRVIKDERIDKILVSAMKQSHKPTLPVLNGMTGFDRFISQEFKGRKYICHCYSEDLPLLKDKLNEQPDADALVMVGPEGDFSIDEVKRAEEAGFISVSLGKSRLRTETAALVAVHLMHLNAE